MRISRRGFAAFAVLALSMTLGAYRADAQGDPAFELQPGMTVIDFVSVAEETPSNTAFSLRFWTRFRTSLSWLTPVAGAVFFPYGSTENGIRNTVAPTIFVGNIFPLLAATRTSGWLSMELPVLITHAPGTGASGNVRDYGRDVVVLPTAYLHLGARALPDFGSVWSRLKVFVQLEQNMTPNKDDATGNRDFFNPSATFGMSLTIGGQRN
jgi:hypothetical protein